MEKKINKRVFFWSEGVHRRSVYINKNGNFEGYYLCWNEFYGMLTKKMFYINGEINGIIEDCEITGQRILLLTSKSSLNHGVKIIFE